MRSKANIVEIHTIGFDPEGESVEWDFMRTYEGLIRDVKAGLAKGDSRLARDAERYSRMVVVRKTEEGTKRIPLWALVLVEG